MRRAGLADCLNGTAYSRVTQTDAVIDFTRILHNRLYSLEKAGCAAFSFVKYTLN